jgi:hypothetical protein
MRSPIASRKNVLEMRFVASTKKVLQMVCEKCGCMARTVLLRDRVLLAGAEDRATLESDLSADAGACTDGQGILLCPFCCPSGMP